MRLSENYKAKSSTRWVLNLVAHMELRSFEDRLFFLDEMILIIDEGLFRGSHQYLQWTGIPKFGAANAAVHKNVHHKIWGESSQFSPPRKDQS